MDLPFSHVQSAILNSCYYELFFISPQELEIAGSIALSFIKGKIENDIIMVAIQKIENDIIMVHVAIILMVAIQRTVFMGLATLCKAGVERVGELGKIETIF